MTLIMGRMNDGGEPHKLLRKFGRGKLSQQISLGAVISIDVERWRMSDGD